MIAAMFVLPFLLLFLWFGTFLRYISYLVDIGVLKIIDHDYMWVFRFIGKRCPHDSQKKDAP